MAPRIACSGGLAVTRLMAMRHHISLSNYSRCRSVSRTPLLDFVKPRPQRRRHRRPPHL